MNKLLFLLGLISANAFAFSPIIFGPNQIAINLEKGICVQNGACTISGSLDPTATAVDAGAGSLYQSSTGQVYFKTDNGSTTNWTLIGGGGGGGTPGAPNLSVQYNVSGAFAGDSEFLRDPANHATIVQSQTFASGGDGQNTSIQADNAGDIGNVSITFNGTDDNATVIAAWNTAHPTQTVTLTSGNPTDIITAQTILVGGGGATGLSVGQTGVTGGLPLSGSYLYNVDSTNGYTMISGAGGAGSLIGSPFTVLNGVLGPANAFHVISVDGTNSPFQQIGISDNATFQTAIVLSQGGASFRSSDSGNSAEINLTATDISWTFNNLNYHLPGGSAPSVNQVLSVSSVTGNDVSLHFSSGGGGSLPNGTQYNQALFWDQAGSNPIWNNFYAATSDTDNNIVMGYKALGASSGGLYSANGTVDNTVIGSHSFEQINGGQVTSYGVRNGNHSNSSLYTNIFGSDNSGDGTTDIDTSNIFGTQNTWGPHGGGITGINIFGSLSHASATNDLVFGNNNTAWVQNQILIGGNITTSPFATGTNLIAIGQTMGFQNATSANNIVAIGGWGGPGNFTSAAFDLCFLGSCNNVTSGSYNTALNSAGQTITVENLDTLLGYNSDITLANSSSIALGAYAKTNQSNQLQIGNNSFAPVNHIRVDTNGSNLDFHIRDSVGFNSAGDQYDFYGGASTGDQFGGWWSFRTTAPNDVTTPSSVQNLPSRFAVFGAQQSGFGDLDAAANNIFSQIDPTRTSGAGYIVNGVKAPTVTSPVTYSGTTGGIEDAIAGGTFKGPNSVTYSAIITFIHNQDVNYTLSSGTTPQVGDTFSTMDGRTGEVIGTGTLGYFIVSLETTGGTGLDVPIPNGSALSSSGWTVILTAPGNLYADEYDVNDSAGHFYPGENCAATQTFSYGAQLGFIQPRGHDIGLIATWVYTTTYGKLINFNQSSNLSSFGDVDAVINLSAPARVNFDFTNSIVSVDSSTFSISHILKLPVQPAASTPACSGGGDDGKVALTNAHQLCICNGTGWFDAVTGLSACTF